MIYVLLLLSGLIAWFLSTITAGGAAILIIPIITFILGAELVAPIISVATVLTNPSRAWLFRKHIDWQMIRYLLPGSIIGAVGGAWSLAKTDSRLIQVFIGIFLISYVLQDKLTQIKLPIKMQVHWFFPLGFGVAFLSGLIGATGPIHNPFMLNYGLMKKRLIGTKAVNSLVMQLAKLISYGSLGVFSLQVAGFGVVLGLGAIIGIFLAGRHLQKITSSRFKNYALALMFISGCTMLIQAL